MFSSQRAGFLASYYKGDFFSRSDTFLFHSDPGKNEHLFQKKAGL